MVFRQFSTSDRKRCPGCDQIALDSMNELLSRAKRIVYEEEEKNSFPQKVECKVCGTETQIVRKVIQ